MEENENKLLKLEEWLQLRIGQSNIQFLFNDFEHSSYLLCYNKSGNYQLKYLPAFQLLATYLPTVRRYHLCLLNFAGKLLDKYSAELGDNLIDTVLPDFVHNLFEDNFALCRGILFEKSSSKDVLIEELKSEVVIRSRKCQYAVLKGSTVCQECSEVKSCKKIRVGSKRSLSKKTRSTTRKLKIIEDSVDDQFLSSHSDQQQSKEFIPEVNKIKIESEPDLSYLTTNAIQDSSYITTNIIPARSRIIIDQDDSSRDLSENSFDQVEESEQIVSEDENVLKLSERRKFRRKNARICSTNEENLIKEEFFEPSDLEGDDEKPRRKKSRKEKKVRKACECCNEVFAWMYLYYEHLRETRKCKLFMRAKRKEERKAQPKPEDSNEAKFLEKCPICLDVYTKEGFFKHDQKQHEERIKDLDSPVECPTCEKLVDTKRMLNIHFEKEHTNNCGEWTDDLLCLVCLKPSKKRYIKNHYLSTHSGKDKKFLCNICGKRTKVKSNLKKHIINKHGVSPDLSTELSRHICDHCGKSYPSVEVLKQHIRIYHSTGRIHRCEECDKDFYTLRGLMTHKVCMHLKIRPFQCKSCSYTSGEMTGIYKHFQKRHGVRGVRTDVIILEEELKKIRKILNYNYCGNSAANY